MYSRTVTKPSTSACWDDLLRLRRALDGAEAVVIGAGAGLSAAAGFAYSGQRFAEHFGDFIAKYGFRDMYSGGFYPFATLEEYWGYWSRYICLNRYQDPPKPVYRDLLRLVEGKDYFVLTTNVDHCFQKAGFAKKRLFYTQGDYGLWQCARPCHGKTYDNEAAVKRMVAEQREGKIPSALVPRCPVCGAPMAMNLRMDGTFVEDRGWHRAARRYGAFLRRHKDRRVLFLELGVGDNTPGIIKYPFWRMAGENPKAVYACLNLERAACPSQLQDRAVILPGDIGAALEALRQLEAAGERRSAPA